VWALPFFFFFFFMESQFFNESDKLIHSEMKMYRIMQNTSTRESPEVGIRYKE